MKIEILREGDKTILKFEDDGNAIVIPAPAGVIAKFASMIQKSRDHKNYAGSIALDDGKWRAIEDVELNNVSQ